jgi:tripartite-type tricarboxylate transporter receptor subunit TctC
MRYFRFIAAACLAAMFAIPAQAADWPTHPVRIIVPFAAGGSADTLGRIFGEALSKKFGQQFVIENRGGAGGLVGTVQLMKADPDGYTFGVSGIASHVIAPATTPNAGFDPVKDFAHVDYFGGPPIVMIAHPSLHVKTLKELIDVAKKSSDPIGYVSPGAGTLGNLVAEYWAGKVGIKLNHIPYRGAAQAITDLIAGHVKLGSMTFTTASQQIRAGKVVPLAVTSANRLKEFPDVPTFKELGYPDMVATTWFSLSAPKGTPKEIVDKVNAAVNEAMDDPTVQKRLAIDAIETQKMSPEEFTKFIATENTKWGPIAKASIKK